ncbi:MAG: diacylglycerol/polyprenol kinase family protein [Candidatus Woesearchaeota archaeon]
MFNKKEIRRQSAHLFFGLVIVLLLDYELLNGYALAVISVIIILLSIAASKTRLPLTKYIRLIQRKNEREGMQFKGMIFYALGCTLVVFIFPKDIALAAIMILALGDSTSRLVGPMGYLRYPFNNKRFLEGIVAGAIVATMGAWAFVDIIPAMIAASGAMIIEGIDMRINTHKIDDNLTIPLVSALILFLI